MGIYIFDIDGTLTSTNPGQIDAAGYSTHAFWDLLTFHFVENKQALKNEIEEWRPHVAGLTHEAFIASSAGMMQRALLQTIHDLSERDVVDYARKITHDFITADVVIADAITFLNQKAEEGHICILSTGSYQSGAAGFLKALSEAGLISPAALDHIMISGAIVDWERKQLIHANIHNNKIKGINDLLDAKFGFRLEPFSEPNSNEIYVYADDPDGNDFGILSLAAPENRFVIAHEKNRDASDRLEYFRGTWDEVIKEKTFFTNLQPT